MAKVLIIGASRGIGLETVNAALKAGHSVRALARSARRIRVDHPKLEKMAGDALEMATGRRNSARGLSLYLHVRKGAPDQPAKIAHRERVSADSRSRSAVLGLR